MPKEIENYKPSNKGWVVTVGRLREPPANAEPAKDEPVKVEAPDREDDEQ
jgi:hypothetical protein